MKFFPTLAICLIAITFSAGCRKEKELVVAPNAFPVEIGTKLAYLELAASPIERREGLRFREKLNPDHGMAFIFKYPQRPTFWGKGIGFDTDLGHFDASGKLLGTVTIPSESPAARSMHEGVLISLMMPFEWFARNGVRPGARIKMEGIYDALRARGIPIDDYPFESGD
ncbi:MAG: DUF192 domain-containing protein [Lentimonas sp.]